LKPLERNILFLLIFEFIVLLCGYIFISNTHTGLRYSEIILLSVIFMLIAMLSLIIFFRGQTRDPSAQTMHSLVSVSSKFLTELIFVFFWFFIAKKTSLPSVLLFFVLYLAFTLFSVIVILKTLKNKSL
jgi:hypothetical protein